MLIYKVIGAGISVAAGIPDFRSKGKLPTLPEMQKKKLRDMFDVSVLSVSTMDGEAELLPLAVLTQTIIFQNPLDRALFCRLIATLFKTSASAQPTQFHQLLKVLDDRGTLLRVYTQNIDGLETRAGLQTYQPQQAEGQTAKCIPLHGTLQHMRCNACQTICLLEPYYHSLSSGILPSCSTCDAKQKERLQMGKRGQAVPDMLPNVLLYGTDSPDAEYIGSVMKQDLGSALGNSADLLIVVGTSMKVPGTIKSVRAFSSNLRRHPPPRGISFRTVYLNLESPSQHTQDALFDACIQADCQAVASLILNEMGHLDSTNNELSRSHRVRDEQTNYQVKLF